MNSAQGQVGIDSGYAKQHVTTKSTNYDLESNMSLLESAVLVGSVYGHWSTPDKKEMSNARF
jgi:hypothetical protein